MNPSLTELEITLNSHWPAIGSIADIQSISQEKGINSRNFRIQTDNGGLYLLKLTDPEQALNHAQALQVQAYCAEKGAAVPTVIPPESNPKGPFTLDKPHFTISLQVYLTPHPEKTAADQPDFVAAELGQLHRILESYPQTVLEKSGYEPLSARELQICQQSQSDFAGGILPKLKELQARCALPDHLPKQIVHLDCHPGNVLVSENSDVFIVDFGHMIHTHRILAVAFACHRFCGFDDLATRTFLKHYQVFNPLTHEELEWLHISIAQEALRRIQFLLRSHFLHNDTRWDRELPRQHNILESALSYQN